MPANFQLMMILGLIAGGLSLLAWLVPPLVLIVIGARGKPRWSSPHCAKCDYDLRGQQPADTEACPECGADLTKLKAVKFARPSTKDRGWALILLGIAAILLPVVGYAGIFAVQFFGIGGALGNNPAALSRASVDDVISTVAATPNEPWAWQELESRISSGKMSDEQINASFAVLLDFINAERKRSGHVSLSWQSGFFEQMLNSGKLSDEQLMQFAKAYHGPAKVVEFDKSSSRNGERLEFTIKVRNPFSSNVGKLVNSVVKASHGGQEIEIVRQSDYGDDLQSQINKPDGADPNEIEFEVIRALIAENDAIGVSSQTAVKDWPPPLVMWRETASINSSIEVENKLEIEAVTDPSRNPQTVLSVPRVSIADMVAARSGEKVRIASQFDVRSGEMQMAISGDVFIVINGEKHKAGQYAYFSTGSGTTSSGGRVSVVVDDLDPSIKAVEVHIEPNAEHVEDWENVDAYWAKPIILKAAIRRLDLAKPITIE